MTTFIISTQTTSSKSFGQRFWYLVQAKTVQNAVKRLAASTFFSEDEEVLNAEKVYGGVSFLGCSPADKISHRFFTGFEEPAPAPHTDGQGS